MSKESSVAPKERVNIRFKPGTGDAKEEVELPLKLLVVGDFTLRQDETPVEELPLTSVDKDTFGDVLRSQNLALDLSVPNKLAEPSGEDAGNMTVSLKFDGLEDFGPEAVAEQVPELQALLDLRNALLALKGPLGNVPAFRKTIQSLVEDSDSRSKLLAELGLGGK